MGEFPNYHDLTRKSMRTNHDIDFFIFTDQVTTIEIDQNIKLIPTSLEDLSRRLSEKLNSIIVITDPLKLPDTRPTWFDIYNQYFTETDWWGFFDLEILFGNLRKFLPEQVLIDNDIVTAITKEKKIHGPFSLLKAKYCTLYKKIENLIPMINSINSEDQFGNYSVDETSLYKVIIDSNLKIYDGYIINSKKIQFIRYGKKSSPAIWKNGNLEIQSYKEDYHNAYDINLYGCDNPVFHVKPDHQLKLVADDEILIRSKYDTQYEVEGENHNLYIDLIYFNYFHMVCEYIPSILELHRKFRFEKLIIVDKAFYTNFRKFHECFKFPFQVENSEYKHDGIHLVSSTRINRASLLDLKYLRKKLKKDSTLPKKILISRRNNRKIPDAIKMHITSNDYKEIYLEDLNLYEQQQYFFNAEKIIAAHGAGLANLIFCDKNTSILEFNNSFNPRCFVHLVQRMNLLFGFGLK